MGWMKKGLLIGGVAMALIGCGNNQQVKNSSASGSLALSNDDSLLYAADTDNGVVSVVDTRTNSKSYEVQVGARPFKVAVAADDTVFVANRGSRSVSVIRKGERQVSAELTTGVDPTGMAVSFDGKTLYVVSATSKDNNEYGLLQAFDTATLEEKYAQPLGYEPRAIALTSNEQALITEYKGEDKGADVIQVDLKTGTTMNGGNTGLYDSVNFTKVDNNGGAGGLNFASFKSRGQTDVVVTPSGDRAFVTTVWAREDNISRQPSSTGGYYAAGGPCNVGAVATAGIVTMNVGSNGSTQPKVDDLTDCASRGTNTNTDVDFPPTAMGTGGVNSSGGLSNIAVQGPSAIAVDPTGEWIFVVNKETSNVAIMPAWRRTGRDGESIDFQGTGSSFRSVVDVNMNAALSSGADGIALTKDGRTAFVYNQFDHNVVRLGNPEGGPMSQVRVTATVDLGLKDTLPAEAAKGRRFFFDAKSTQMSSEFTHVSCGSCHLEGRDDGHVWGFPTKIQSVSGQRQTPSLVGRKTSVTLPMHWEGEFDDFAEFMNHTVVSRMGGKQDPVIQGQIQTWIESQELPENPNHHANLTEVQLRGQVAFMKAECGTCHSGEYLTDQKLQTVSTRGANTMGTFDTPSLKGISRSGPFMHDGTVRTLRDRVFQGGNTHGKLDVLTAAEQSDLLEYLKSL